MLFFFLFNLNKFLPKSFIIRPIGVTTRKKTSPIRDQGSRDDLTYTLLRAGIQVGDTFLVYHSGEPLVVRKQDAGASYYLATPNKIQIEQVAAGVRKIRRDLRWSHGSFCHGVPSQTPLEVDLERKIVV